MGVFEWLAMFAVVSVAVAVAERIIEAGVIEAVRGRVAICGGAVAAAGGYLMIASDAWQVGLAAASLGIFTMMVAAMASGGGGEGIGPDFGGGDGGGGGG